MPTNFVDFAGMNTLISSSFDNTNTLTSGRNTVIFSSGVPVHQELVGINLHRNGPYGYSSWKQLRVSENPITRNHVANSTMTFVTQPGPVRNVSLTGELRVRDRNSALQTFTEPAIAQKAFPLVWNVGRHIKDENGNIDFENPERFSIISSYANEKIGFANHQVDKLHDYDPSLKTSDYKTIYDLYANGGLNDESSPITHWEFLQYREVVFPHMKNQFQNENLERPNFESFYRHKREDRTKRVSNDLFGKEYASVSSFDSVISQSTWVLDENERFLTRTYSSPLASVRFGTGEDIPGNSSFYRNGEGVLISTLTQYHDSLSDFTGTGVNGINNTDIAQVNNGVTATDRLLTPGPLYMRRISLSGSESVSNPSGMEIYGTGSELKLFQGGALWQAGETRQIKDSSGNYISASKQPFHDTYEHYIEEARRKYKNFSVVPEFRISTQIEDYVMRESGIELDMFDVTGGADNAKNSGESNFYEVYSNSDFMRQFELINEDHREFANGKTLSLRCKAVKKFLPYEGFYPAQRSVDLTKRFYDSFGNRISLYNGSGVQLQNFNYGKQMVMTPLFAPGVLFNSIKSGVAVDYPIITSSLNVTSGYGGEFTISQDFDRRIPFEALVDPITHLAGTTLTCNEPHPSGNISASAFLDVGGDELYGLMANNFLAEIPEFFLPNDNLSSIVSKKQGEGILLDKDEVYGMRVYMRKTYDNSRLKVYHSSSASYAYFPPQDILSTGTNSFKENFTMYSRPSAFGPPSLGMNGGAGGGGSWFHFDSDTRLDDLGNVLSTFVRDSRHGFNFPFTPPYYHGEAWCDMWITGSGELLSIKQIQSQVTASSTRFDSSYLLSNGWDNSNISGISFGPQRLADNAINNNAVQLTSSINIFTTAKTLEQEQVGNLSFVVDTSLDQDARWVIQTKFECPMLNFNHVSGSDYLTLPTYGSGSVPRGMWHQYGRIPENNEGVFMGVKPIEDNWQLKVMGRSDIMSDLAEKLGFSGKSTKLGQIRSSKIIYEAVVAIPFIEEQGKRRFFLLDPLKVERFRSSGGPGSALYESLTSGEPEDQIGRSVLRQLNTMKRYIFPPSFDFLSNTDIDPIAMYIFEFSHVLSQQDLSDIWQNLPPDIGLEMDEAEVAITHPLLKKELLGQGGERGNTLIDMPNKLKWMVFKVKQRAASNYFKKIAGRNPILNTNAASSNSSVDEFGDTSNIQYNWPYDFFSLVELAKIDSEVEFGNFDEDEIKNYTNSIPEWQAQQSDEDKIVNILSDPSDSVNENASVADYNLNRSLKAPNNEALGGPGENPGGPQRKGIRLSGMARATTDRYFGGAGITFESESESDPLDELLLEEERRSLLLFMGSDYMNKYKYASTGQSGGTIGSGVQDIAGAFANKEDKRRRAFEYVEDKYDTKIKQRGMDLFGTINSSTVIAQNETPWLRQVGYYD